MLCAFVSAAITLLYPLLTRHITKDVLEGGMSNAFGEIIKTGAIMLVLIVLQGICGYFVDYRGHAMGAMMERDMRNELFDHYQKLSFGFFDKQNTGQLMSRINHDLLSLTELYHHGPEDYLISLVKFMGAFVILLQINYKLALVVFIFLPLMAVFVLHFNKRVQIAVKKNRERMGDINARVEDNLSGIRVVKSFANEALEKEKFSFHNDRFLNSRKSTYRNEAYFTLGIETFLHLILVAVVLFGSAAIMKETLDLVDLITFLLYIGNLTGPIQKLAWMTMQFQEGVASFKRFMEIMNLEPEIQDSKNAIVISKARGDVEFRKVGFKYHEDHDYILENLSLHVRAGEFVAIVGSSGVGKTTLCSLIPRFYEVTEGEVMVDGINVKEIALNALRRNIGVVQQDIYLFSGSVSENIRYGKPDASMEEIIEAAKKANAHNFIMKLPQGYDTDIGQRGVRLSGGQKQRLSIARVFLKNPPILIFDEATSSLDNESEKFVQDAMVLLSKNRTTFVIAHRLSTIKNAKRILVLTEQGIAEQGTHEDLMAQNGVYAQLYHAV